MPKMHPNPYIHNFISIFMFPNALFQIYNFVFPIYSLCFQMLMMFPNDNVSNVYFQYEFDIKLPFWIFVRINGIFNMNKVTVPWYNVTVFFAKLRFPWESYRFCIKLRLLGPKELYVRVWYKITVSGSNRLRKLPLF